MADMTNRLVHFEIMAADPERAAAFYRNVFGWNVQKWEGGSVEYWMVMTGEGNVVGSIHGGLGRREGQNPEENQPINAFACIIEVEDTDAMAGKITSSGGKVTKMPYDLPQVGRLAYCLDTEGNHFGIIKSAPQPTS